MVGEAFAFEDRPDTTEDIGEVNTEAGGHSYGGGNPYRLAETAWKGQ